jgi:cell division protease FtsH
VARRRSRPSTLQLVGIVAMVVALVVVAALALGDDAPEPTPLSGFQEQLADGHVATAELGARSDTIEGELTDGTEYRVAFPEGYTERITQDLLDADVDLEVDPQAESIWQVLLLELLPIAVLVGVLVWLVAGVQGGGGIGSRFGRAKPRRAGRDRPQVTFGDVAGADEAVEELREVVDYLESPERFEAIGARIPRGVLLFGPPGTGKTLLARAVAGEAGAEFFSISGSDFVEMFVGVGASRVRDLFAQAKEAAPAIVFVDEIDAVGRQRGAGMGGGHDEREQTLNQLLVEMDGFDPTSGLVLIAATNRPDVLDPALLRPGRFDRHIVVDRPDMGGRRAILELHAKGLPLVDHGDLDLLARRSAGMTGADLANVVNEAALLTARRGATEVTRQELSDALERVLAGPERRSKVLSEREKRVVAYHEAGHALVGHVLPNTDTVHKVSVLARGRALGWTMSIPDEDRSMRTRAELRDEMAMLMGGRTAEEIIFGDPTTGAANDIERATDIARAMVTQFGMSDAVGPRQLGPHDDEPFLGRDTGHVAEHSDELAATVDAEVRRLLDEAHEEAREVLTLHRTTLDQLADALVVDETLEGDALDARLGHLDVWLRHEETGDASPVGNSGGSAIG